MVFAFVAFDVTVNVESVPVDWFAVNVADPDSPVPDTARFNCPSPTVIELVVAAVINPFSLTVIAGIAVLDPKVPVLLLTVAKVVAVLSEVISPVKLGMLVVESAVPTKFPWKDVALTIPVDGYIVIAVPTEEIPARYTFELNVENPTNVEIPLTCRLLVVVIPLIPTSKNVEIPDMDKDVPTTVSAVTEVPWNSPNTLLKSLSAVTEPATDTFSFTNKLFLKVPKPTNVETPTTFKVSLMLVISNSVLPSTSKSPLASILPAKVDTPDIFTSSSSVCPSTSRSPLASILLANVTTPDTDKISVTTDPAVIIPVIFWLPTISKSDLAFVVPMPIFPVTSRTVLSSVKDFTPNFNFGCLPLTNFAILVQSF